MFHCFIFLLLLCGTKPIKNNYQKFYWTGVSTSLNMTSGVMLYPNPAGSTLFLTALPQGNHLISITDMAGKQILTTSSKGESTTSIYISQLASGVYFIEAAGQHLKFVKE
ncbi:MAG: T9SS type A sorting domain-containing protein [Flavobacteriaceae bacterium]|nr:T9SS type A sorting domain-containing protein [Flavobacteriaceae bacterium]